MKHSVHNLLAVGCLLAMTSNVWAGPFTHTPIAANDPAIVRWASAATRAPGPHEASPDALHALGPADGNVASLGELAASQSGSLPPGEITVSFGSSTLFNGSGNDLVIFENAFQFDGQPDFWYAELAFVEVSTNGVDFARFPATSLNTEGAGQADTDIITPFGRAYSGANISNIHGLAGFDGPASFGGTPRGTPFDLDDLLNQPQVTNGSVDLNDVNYVRLIDILGNGSVPDDFGNPIFDAFDAGEPPTDVNGFDLDAVGLIHAIPEPTSCLLLWAGLGFGMRRRK